MRILGWSGTLTILPEPGSLHHVRLRAAALRSSSSTRWASGATSSRTSGGVRPATGRSPEWAWFVALAIVVAVNYLSARQNKRWDLTANQQNSLSEQTVKVLQGLTSPVKFTVFDRQTEIESLPQSPDEYAYQSESGVG